MAKVGMRQVCGIWKPNTDPDNYVRDSPIVEGTPCYQQEQIMMAIGMCGERRRTVIDGGAHIGLWALQFQHHFQNVIAFEPVPTNFECLEKNIAEHWKTEAKLQLNCAALSDKDATISLNTSKSTKSYAWTALLDDDARESYDTIEVPCHRLDTFNLQNVDLIKLDVEGHELEALQGAIETIKRYKPIVLIEDKHVKGRPACNYLEELGMRRVWDRKYDCLYAWGKSKAKSRQL